MSTKLVIVGGVAGGASAAARARRIDENAEIIMFERGKYISFANCGLPYYIGGVIKERNDLLVTTEEKFISQFEVDVRTLTEVVEIDRKNKVIKVRDLRQDKEYSESYDKLILSQGAAPIEPPLPGIDGDNIFSLRDIPDADKIKEYIDKKNPKRSLVVGGGFIGLEMMESLHHLGMEVTLIELADQVLPVLDPEMASILQNYIRSRGVRLVLSEGVKSFEHKDGVTIVTTSKGNIIETDIVLLAVGVKPENKLAKNAGLKLGTRGGITTDDHMLTSDPDIYAVGDATEINDLILSQRAQIPLAGPANKQGRIAADNALGRDIKYKGALGTSVVKVFDFTAGMTGATAKALDKADKKYDQVFVHLGSHASYYPGSTMMCVKLIYNPDDGKVYGAQIVGMEGVDKRVDVVATALSAKMTVFDLEELELTYAPPFSSAKDPVNVAGMVAANSLRYDVDIISWDQVDQLGDDWQVMDVRDEAEIKLAGEYPGTIKIPLGQLRKSLDKLDKGKKYAIHCASGRRSYLAARILKQKGFQAVNITGGFKSYKEVQQDKKARGNSPSGPVIPHRKPAPPKVILPGQFSVDLEVSACGIQCPGPIMKLKERMEELNPGQVIQISATDPGFYQDVQAWSKNTGNELLSIEEKEKGIIQATIRKTPKDELTQAANDECPDKKSKTIIVFSNDLDRVMAAFIIANGAASMGSKVTMFFTFWGLNVLRRKKTDGLKKDTIEQMFGAMMPKGPDELTLSKMNMMGMGTAMMKHVMNNKNVQSLDMLIKAAIGQGVRLVACTMTMDVMGIKDKELIEGVEKGGVATYLDVADDSNLNLFI